MHDSSIIVLRRVPRLVRLVQGTYCKTRMEELLEEYSKVVKEVQEIKEMDRRAEQIKAKNEYTKARLQVSTRLHDCHNSVQQHPNPF